MRIAGIDVAIFVIYILFVIALGLYGARRTQKTKRDYFLAGDKVPWWMVGGSIVASNISSHHFVGIMGFAYALGFAAMTVEWGAILLGFNALLWIFLPHYLRNGFYTMPEFLERRFSSTARTSFAGLVLLTYLFVEIAAVLCLGATALDKLLGLDLWISIIVLTGMTGVYTILGGLRSVIWTEMLQLVVLLTGGIVLSVAAISKVGWHDIALSSKDWGLFLPASNKAFPWTMWLGGLTSISIFYCAANQFIVQRVLAAKDEWHARMGVVFTDYLKFFLPLIILVPGLMAFRLCPNLEKPDFAFSELVRTLLPPGLVGLVLAGLVAAVMSHISGAVNSCTTIATIDFYIPFVKKDADDRQAVGFGKLAGVVILLLGMTWAIVLTRVTDRPMFGYLLDAYGYFAPGIATMFLLGTFWKRATNAGAMAAGLLTIPLSIVLQFTMPDVAGLARATIVFWSCVAIAVLVSLVTKPKPEAEIESVMWHRSSLTLPKQQQHLMRGLRNPAIWWAIVTAAVLFMYVRFAVDHNPPRVTKIVATSTAGQAVFAISFSEPVIEFTQEKIRLTGGTIAMRPDKETGKDVPDFSGNGNTFTIKAIPDGPGEVRCTVPVGAASDNSGNRNKKAAGAVAVVR